MNNGKSGGIRVTIILLTDLWTRHVPNSPNNDEFSHGTGTVSRVSYKFPGILFVTAKHRLENDGLKIISICFHADTLMEYKAAARHPGNHSCGDNGTRNCRCKASSNREMSYWSYKIRDLLQTSSGNRKCLEDPLQVGCKTSSSWELFNGPHYCVARRQLWIQLQLLL